MVGATVAAVIFASIGLAGGVGALLRSEPPIPAVPIPTPPPAGTQDLITVITIPYQEEVPIGAVVIDPDGEPSAALSLRIGRWGIPLGWSPDGERLLFTLPAAAFSCASPTASSRSP